MYKTVFFDLVNTLVRYDPPPEVHQGWVLDQLGINVAKEDIRRGFWAANDYFTRESARWSMEKRPPEEKEKVWIEYEMTLLRSAGVEASSELAIEALKLALRLERRVVMFEDTVSALSALRERGLVLGLVSNLDTTLDQFCGNMGLDAHLDFVIISHEVGCEKPHPGIFEAALERANAKAADAIMVGDQYHSDIIGALAAGIKPLWLDRDGVFNDSNGCQRIGGLAEVLEYI